MVWLSVTSTFRQSMRIVAGHHYLLPERVFVAARYGPLDTQRAICESDANGARRRLAFTVGGIGSAGYAIVALTRPRSETSKMLPLLE